MQTPWEQSLGNELLKLILSGRNLEYKANVDENFFYW